MVAGLTVMLVKGLKRNRVTIKPWLASAPEPRPQCPGADVATIGPELPRLSPLPDAPRPVPSARQNMQPIPGAAPLASFLIDKREVTVAQYRACVRNKRCTEPGRDPSCTSSMAGHDRHPVTCVSQDQAAAYCTYVRKRLPSDAEWQH